MRGTVAYVISQLFLSFVLGGVYTLGVRDIGWAQATLALVVGVGGLFLAIRFIEWLVDR